MDYKPSVSIFPTAMQSLTPEPPFPDLLTLILQAMARVEIVGNITI